MRTIRSIHHFFVLYFLFYFIMYSLFWATRGIYNVGLRIHLDVRYERSHYRSWTDRLRCALEKTAAEESFIMENRGFSCFRVSSARVCRVWGIIKGGIENRIKRFWVERREVVRIFWIEEYLPVFRELVDCFDVPFLVNGRNRCRGERARGGRRWGSRTRDGCSRWRLLKIWRVR